MSDVISVTNSGYNFARWVLQLSCGHEVWVSSNSRPTRTKFKCGQCARTPTQTDERGDDE